jgi:hypothetical protein
MLSRQYSPLKVNQHVVSNFRVEGLLSPSQWFLSQLILVPDDGNLHTNLTSSEWILITLVSTDINA